MMGLSANVLVILQLVHLLAFSIGMLAFVRSELGTIIQYWVVSNVLAAGFFILVLFRGAELNFLSFTLPNTLNFAAGMFRVAALAHPFRWGQVRSWDVRLLYAAMVTFGILLLTGITDFSLLLVLLSGALLCSSCAVAVLTRRFWRGVIGQRMMFACLALSAFAFFTRATWAYPFGTYTSFVGNHDQTVLTLLITLVTTFFMEAAFLFLIFGRLQRNRTLAERRAGRMQGKRMILLERAAEAERLAAERLGMLNILTHEVRQPLNNAQAALQSVIAEIVPAAIQRDKLQSAAMRTQAVLDDVSLSLSNAIVGAGFMQRAERPELQSCEVLAIAELAHTDCPADEGSRIRLSTGEREIYLDVNPVLLRLALRNLLHNALKFSPPDSEVLLEVAHDNQRFGVTFTVRNELETPKMVAPASLNEQVQQRRVPTDGRHLGLMIVRETAQLHRGTLRVLQDNPGRVAMELFIPA